jgi:hypothetical protein
MIVDHVLIRDLDKALKFSASDEPAPSESAIRADYANPDTWTSTFRNLHDQIKELSVNDCRV